MMHVVVLCCAVMCCQHLPQQLVLRLGQWTDRPNTSLVQYCALLVLLGCVCGGCGGVRLRPQQACGQQPTDLFFADH